MLPLSGFSSPASSFTKLVFPRPFSPNTPITCFLGSSPLAALNWNLPSFFLMSFHTTMLSLLVALEVCVYGYPCWPWLACNAVSASFAVHYVHDISKVVKYYQVVFHCDDSFLCSFRVYKLPKEAAHADSLLDVEV